MLRRLILKEFFITYLVFLVWLLDSTDQPAAEEREDLAGLTLAKNSALGKAKNDKSRYNELSQNK